METKTTPEGPDDWHLTDDLHAETGKGDPFAAAIRATRMSMLVTDPRQPDNPIVFANNAFLHLTGYERHEVIGQNCRFLQGPDTDQAAIGRVRSAVKSRTDINVDMLNYRKDGTPFWNALYISPVANEKGELQFFFASQLDVSDRKEEEKRVRLEKDRFESAVSERTRALQEALDTQKALLHEVDHRVKNNLQMIASLIAMQSRTISDEKIRKSLRSMLERVEALSTVHRRLYQSEDLTSFDVGEFVRDLVDDLVNVPGREGIEARLELDSVAVPAQKAAAIALMINELVTNSLKHAFGDEQSGHIGVTVKGQDGKMRVEVSDDGVGAGNADTSKSFGMRLVHSLARQLGADIDWEDGQPGTRVVISMPTDATEPEESVLKQVSTESRMDGGPAGRPDSQEL